MRKVKFVSVLVLLALLLSAAPGGVMARDPLPPRKPIPTPELPEVSDAVVTESSSVELITKQTEAGVRQVPVMVNRLEAVQTVSVPNGAAPRAMAGGVTVTLWRSMSWYANGDPNDPDTLWTVWTEARTSTDQCVDQVNVFAEHQYKSGGAWQDFWPGDTKTSDDSDPCEDNSGKAVSGKGDYIADTTHRSGCKTEKMAKASAHPPHIGVRW